MRLGGLVLVMGVMLAGAAYAEQVAVPIPLAVAPNPAVMKLQVLDATVKPTRAGGSVAVHMVLANPTEFPLHLVGASSVMAGQTQLQTYAPDSHGLMQVQPLKALPLPPKTEVLLLPGVLELQLIGLTADLQPGLELPLKLKFSDGAERTIRLTIQGDES